MTPKEIQKYMRNEIKGFLKNRIIKTVQFQNIESELHHAGKKIITEQKIEITLTMPLKRNIYALPKRRK